MSAPNQSANPGTVAVLVPTQNNRDICSLIATAELPDLNCLGANQGGVRAIPRRK